MSPRRAWHRAGTTLAARLARNLGCAAALLVLAGVLGANPLEFRTAAGAMPVNHQLPQITGDPRLGGELHCSRGDWDEPEGSQYPVSYQWMRDSLALTGRTSPDYTPVAADVGHTLRCDVTATGSTGSATAGSGSMVPPAPAVFTAPTVGGDPRVGQKLTCTRGDWNDAGVPPYATSYRWLRSGEPIVAATDATYTLTVADVNRYVSCRVSVGTLSSSTSGALIAAAPANRATPEISGDLRLGGTLRCSRGDWDDEGLTPYAVTTQWLRDGVDIVGATADAYDVAWLDVAHQISCRVRAADITDAVSPAVVPTRPSGRAQPVIEGDLRLGRSVTCARGTWDDGGRAGDYDVRYEWYRAGVLVADTRGYDVTSVDVGKALACQVVAEDLSTWASQTIVVPAPEIRTAPLLSGGGRLGRTLTCSRGVWDDSDVAPYNVTYRWLRSGTPIPGETAATHVVTLDDVDLGLTCRVTAAGASDADSAIHYVPRPRNMLRPRVEGDPRVGEQLTCTRGDWDEPSAAPYEVTYQWYRYYYGLPIDGATEATYTPSAAQADDYLVCGVTAAGRTAAYSDSARVTSQATGLPAAIIVAPAISGDPRLRHAVACSRGSWNDTAGARYATTYRWRRDGIAIAAATASSYTIAMQDMGRSLTCEVTAAGQSTAASGAISPAAPETLAPAGIAGDPRLRGTLTCSRGDWYDDEADRYAVTYRWQRNGQPIIGATASTHEVTAADLGMNVGCEVRAEGLTSAVPSAVYVRVPRVKLSPAVSGDPRPRSTLACSRGTWDDLPGDRYGVDYRWMRGSALIAGATSSTYTVTGEDIGFYVYCVVRAEDVASVDSQNSVAISEPRIKVSPHVTGPVRLRQTVACSRGDWDDTPSDRYAVSYRWQLDDQAIPVGTSATHTITASDVNHRIRCVVRAENRTEAASAWIWVYPPRNVVAPAISGVPRLYRALACSRGDWDDTASDRYAVAFTWLRDGTPIADATGSTYTTQRADVGRYLTCRARAEGFSDAVSASYAAHIYAPQLVLLPAITGQPHIRGQLTCSRGTWDDTAARRYAVSYQWYRSGYQIQGATDPTYVVGTDDVGRGIACFSTAEGLTDASSAATYIPGASATTSPRIEGVAYPRREVTCSRGEWNDSAGRRYAVTYRWRRNFVDIPGADRADRIVTTEDVGAYLDCVVTAEGRYDASSSWIRPGWAPLQLSVVPDADAVAAHAADAYTVRLRNPNPVSVAISTLQLVLPGGFSYRAGTTTGALTAEPQFTGPGNLTLYWNGGFAVPSLDDAAVRVGVNATAQTGDHFASARAYAADSSFAIPETGQTARVTIEGSGPPSTACTVVGTEGPDVLDGTAGDDVVCGLGGDDRLRGQGGDDELWGGAGDDRLEGGIGDDELRGADGADVLDGATGADVLRGGGGLDTVTYASRTAPVAVTIGGTDTNDGAAGEHDTVATDVEIVRGGRGADELIGSPGADELYGAAGDDLLEGGAGAGDLLDGGDGADVLTDVDGAIDRLVCGGGVDRYSSDLLDRLVGCEENLAALPPYMPYQSTGWRFRVVAHGELAGFEGDVEPPGFATGRAAFGSGGACPLQPTVGTPWSRGTDLLLRRDVVLPAGAGGVRVALAVDNDFVLYWNGTEIGRGSGDFCPRLDKVVINVPPGLVRVGSNLLALRAIDRGDESFVDVKVGRVADPVAP